MANSQISVTEGSGKNIASYSFTEVTTKEAQRVSLNTSAGAETGIAALPLQVSLANTAANGTALNVTATAVGTVAHDSADSGAPVKIGFKAESALSTATLVADGDRTDAYGDIDGTQLVRLQMPLGDLLSERVSDTSGTSTAFTSFGATASTRNYVTTIVVYNSSATNGYIDFRDGTAGSILFTVPIPTVGGSVITSSIPLFKTSANTALAYDVSGALTTVYISISGFKSKV